MKLQLSGRTFWLSCVIAFCLSGCASFQPLEEPELQVTGFKLQDTDNVFRQPFELTVQVHNPNDRALDVERIVFDFALDGVSVIRGRSQSIPVIGPYGDGEFTIKGGIGLLDAAKLLVHTLGAGPDERFDYVLNAKVTLRNQWPSTFNIKREGEVDLGQARRRAAGRLEI
jgi:LEA14-like dessication related protein